MLHQVGVGVLGPVFRAYDPSRDQPFIVKALRVDVTPEQARLLVEALERLTATGPFHPAVVMPVASGIEDGTPYLVQEHLAAESLDLAARRPAAEEVPEILSLLAALADALDAAHGRSVLHGALHLRDIFVAGSRPRVTGFGIVPALEQVGLRGPLRRPYAAPEVVAGQDWAAPADRFALAAVAYELLTGRRPAGAGAQAGAVFDAVDGVPDSEALRAVFAGALAAAPEQRPASAGRFAAELRAALGKPAGRPAARPAVRTPTARTDQLEPAHAEGPARFDYDPDEAGGAPLDHGDRAAAAPAALPAVTAAPVEWPLRPAATVVLAVLLVVAAAAAYRAGLHRGGEPPPAGGPARAEEQPLPAAPDPPASAVARTVPDPAPAPVVAAEPVAGAGLPATPLPVPAPADVPVPPPAAAPNTAPVAPVAAPAAPVAPVAAPAAPAAPEGSGWVLVRTTPPGARVTIGGADRGLTPLSVGDVPFGSFEVEVLRDGYAPETRQVVLSTAAPVAAVGISLSPLAGAAQPARGGAR